MEAEGTPGEGLGRRSNGTIFLRPLYSLTRCFNSHTRRAARSRALVRARVPAAGRSRETEACRVEPLLLPLRERAFGFRPFDLALWTRLATGVLTVKCPFPFMIRFLSSFQAETVAWKAGFASFQASDQCIWFPSV